MSLLFPSPSVTLFTGYVLRYRQQSTEVPPTNELTSSHLIPGELGKACIIRHAGRHPVSKFLLQIKHLHIVFPPSLFVSVIASQFRHQAKHPTYSRLTGDRQLPVRGKFLMSQMLTPKAVTGGCLCGGVRFQVDFAPDHDWQKGVSSPKNLTRAMHLFNFCVRFER